MANFIKKHKTLKLFYLQKINNDYFPNNFPPDIVKACLTTDYIHDKLKLDFRLIDAICQGLKTDGYITIFHDDEYDPNSINTFYIITQDGKKAFIEKTYLRELVQSSLKLWLPIASLIISIIALVFSIRKH